MSVLGVPNLVSKFTHILALFLMLICAQQTLAQENWPRFRGADGTGVVADDPRLPEVWDEKTNLAWRTGIPGWGWSSPCVWGDRVFVTSVHGEAEYEKPKKGLYNGRGRSRPPEGVHHWMVYCLSLKTGDLLWKHEAHSGQPKIARHPKNTYASETPTTDGQRVYVLFGDLGLYCYDFTGKPLWTHKIQAKKTLLDYGAAASPIVHDGQVIFVYDNQSSSYIASLDAQTGQQRWRTSRNETSTWATPFLWKHEQRAEIVVAGRKRNRAYGLDGKLLWSFNGRMSVLTIPSPFVADGLLYLTSGYFQDNKRPVFALSPGAQGDITLERGQTSNDFVRWSLRKSGPYNTSPIVYRGLYYTLLDRGFITCHDAKTSKLIYDRIRFAPGATFTASPWAYNGKVFCLNEDGDTYVIDATNNYKLIRTNSLDALCAATPSIAQGRLLIRTADTICCFTQDGAQ